MARLYRPHIPLEVRCRVAMRQLGGAWPNVVLEEVWPNKGQILDMLLVKLSGLLACAPGDLRLDHDPPLAARPHYEYQEAVGEGNTRRWANRMRYEPDANDPEHLIYREKHAHHIKTNVRGDGAQHPDRVLIKKERKRGRKKRSKVKIRSRGFRKTAKQRRRQLPLPSRRGIP